MSWRSHAPHEHLLPVKDGEKGPAVRAARAYLAWEINLVKQLDAQELSVFRIGH